MKFELNGWVYEANSNLTYNIGYPVGRKGERVRINKRQFIQIMREQVKIYNNKHIAYLAKSHGIELG